MLKSLLSRLHDEEGFTAVGVVLGVVLIVLAFALTASTHSALFLVLLLLGILAIVFL